MASYYYFIQSVLLLFIINDSFISARGRGDDSGPLALFPPPSPSSSSFSFGCQYPGFECMIDFNMCNVWKLVCCDQSPVEVVEGKNRLRCPVQAWKPSVSPSPFNFGGGSFNFKKDNTSQPPLPSTTVKVVETTQSPPVTSTQQPTTAIPTTETTPTTTTIRKVRDPITGNQKLSEDVKEYSTTATDDSDNSSTLAISAAAVASFGFVGVAVVLGMKVKKTQNIAESHMRYPSTYVGDSSIDLASTIRSRPWNSGISIRPTQGTNGSSIPELSMSHFPVESMPSESIEVIEITNSNHPCHFQASMPSPKHGQNYQNKEENLEFTI